MSTGPATVIKRAIDLRKGDVIVAPDGTHHTVTDFWIEMNLATGIVEIDTDTGLQLRKRGTEKYDTYDVLVPSA